MDAILDIRSLNKVYAGGLKALDDIDLQIQRGELFALLGPNGAGKTTLISIVCGLVNPSSGAVTVDGADIQRQFRRARATIGLVPQELHTDMFETVGDTVRFSRGLFGLPPAPDLIERLLRDLSLWEKRDQRIMALSGGMKRRVLIAKALAHEPRLLFLDEPSAGVDVELRRDMWALIRRLRDTGVTIVLTTHYIEEAEQMADRVGVILGGRLVIVEQTEALMRRLGQKQLTLHLEQPMTAIPEALSDWSLELADHGQQLVYSFSAEDEQTGVPALIRCLHRLEIEFTDLNTRQSSLEDIFVDLIRERK